MAISERSAVIVSREQRHFLSAFISSEKARLKNTNEALFTVPLLFLCNSVSNATPKCRPTILHPFPAAQNDLHYFPTFDITCT